MKEIIRYRLYILNPKTEKWKRAEQGKTLKVIAEKMAFNLMVNKDWYVHEGKPLKLRLVCEKVRGKKIEELEEYKITKGWKIKGYFEWDKIPTGY